MSKVSYPWLLDTWQQLQNALDNNVLPSALLVSSSQGIGAEQIVDVLSAALLCNNSSSEACEFCHACSLLEANTHPDLHNVSPLEGKSSISVDQIRECNRYALESSQLNGKRIIIISPAELMTEAAMNALLKTLESPPNDCVFVLNSHEPHRLLPTITSRCQQWHLEASDAAALSWYAEQGMTDIPELYKVLCNGAPLRLVEFLKHNDAFENALTALYEFIKDDFVLPSDFTKAIAKGESLTMLSAISTGLLELQKSYFTELVSVQSHNTLNSLKGLLTYQQAYSMTCRLNQLVEQLTTHSGLNHELLISRWLIESKC
ncbi:DNA polymerase III subunit delta' C-terminal domain-containing protein [Vibrio gallicus]|uniref:DNA polymerase III subunit delta' C-terminal domain-containing protein n=1 Tax=Vibrio gallicus TaxID=190897 RepID=UPI0021C46B35|nr:DNA polymerase III subunit delta' C-terminal domain-containing protein [Vibrio gallicus]